MFKETESKLNIESLPSNISYKSFKNSYCDHKMFDGENHPYKSGGKKLLINTDHLFVIVIMVIIFNI